MKTLNHNERSFRIKALQEELIEYANAKTIEDEIDALVDLVVFAMGTAERMGVIWELHWEEVMRANMKKELCKTAEKSKRGFKLDLCKPENWTPPNHTKLINTFYTEPA